MQCAITPNRRGKPCVAYSLAIASLSGSVTYSISRLWYLPPMAFRASLISFKACCEKYIYPSRRAYLTRLVTGFLGGIKSFASSRCRDQSSSQLAWPSPPNQVTYGDHGTYVPVEEPSTASQADILLSSVQDLRAPRTPSTYPISPHRFITRRQQASQQATFFPRTAGSAKTRSSSHAERLWREAFSGPVK